MQNFAMSYWIRCITNLFSIYCFWGHRVFCCYNCFALFVVGLLLGVFGQHVCAQQIVQGDTLQTLVVRDSLPNVFYPSTFPFDSLAQLPYKNATIAYWLAAGSSGYSKAYGVGGSSTVSLDGLPAHHTQLFWEGIPLNSAMHGTSDISLMPAYLFGGIRLNSDQYATRPASGLGGNIQLDTTTPADSLSHIRLGQHIGSFSQYVTWANISYKAKRYYHTLITGYQTAQNDFYYRRPDTQLLEKMPDAPFEQCHILYQTLRKNKKKNGQFKFATWYQSTNRKLSPLTINSQLESHEQQKDVNWRNSATWMWRKSRWQTQTNVYYTLEYLRYQNQAIALDDTSLASTFGMYHQTEYWHNRKWQLGAQFSGSYAIAKVSAYDNILGKQNRIASGVWAKWHFKQQWWALGSVQYGGQKAGLLPRMEINYQAKNWDWQIDLARYSRLPTLNEWFWQPEGNPQLQPEHGWGTKSRWYGQKKYGIHIWTTQLSVHYKQLNNWVSWLPELDNYGKVAAYGSEFRLGYALSHSLFPFQIQAAYYFTQIEPLGNNPILGKKALYMPTHKGQVFASLGYKNMRLLAVQQFVGQRYYTELNALPSYLLTDIQGQYNLKIRRFVLEFSMQVNNILNTDYAWVAFRPMPRRNYQFAVLLKNN